LNTASIFLSGVSHFSNAAKFYDVAADQNYADAQFAYALCLANGSGLSLDVIEAPKYYKLAADQNHAGAHCDRSSGFSQRAIHFPGWFQILSAVLFDHQSIRASSVHI
jgi:TPR repeat protein